MAHLKIITGVTGEGWRLKHPCEVLGIESEESKVMGLEREWRPDRAELYRPGKASRGSRQRSDVI